MNPVAEVRRALYVLTMNEHKPKVSQGAKDWHLFGMYKACLRFVHWYEGSVMKYGPMPQPPPSHRRKVRPVGPLASLGAPSPAP